MISPETLRRYAYFADVSTDSLRELATTRRPTTSICRGVDHQER
jgi:hypothetical protein